MVMIGLNAKSDEIFITFIDTEYQKSAEIKLKIFQALWRAFRHYDVQDVKNETKIVFEEPTYSNQRSRCASLDFANCLEICEAKGTIGKDTKFDDVAMFPLDDYNCELLNSLTDDVITGKDLADELDKINKPTELRMIKE